LHRRTSGLRYGASAEEKGIRPRSKRWRVLTAVVFALAAIAAGLLTAGPDDDGHAPTPAKPTTTAMVSTTTTSP
jgi:hypothetical protein